MYVAPSIGRMLLSRAIGSIFFVATAVIICIIKEEFNDRRQKKMGSGVFSERPVSRKCKFGNQRQQCNDRRCCERID